MSNVLVTGANRGIGLCLVKNLLAGNDAVNFLKPDYKIIATARNPASASDLNALAASSGGRIAVLALDIDSEASVNEFAKKVSSDFGHIDFAIFNAGVKGDTTPILGLTQPDAVNTFATNAFSPIRLFNALLPTFRAAPAPRVVFVSSVMGSITLTDASYYPAYRASKAALNMFLRCLAPEVPDVALMAIHPGWVKTDMGGDDAPVEPADSARGIVATAAKYCTKETSVDKMYVYDGSSLPW
jgi:NAD(P)-dependent dehydrogenase (short-subunit alcohol dehydrogenase family)